MFLFSFFFFKKKTAYELRISDWSSDVCSSDLEITLVDQPPVASHHHGMGVGLFPGLEARADGTEQGGIEALALRRSNGPAVLQRSEERRVGKEGVSTCRSRW